MQEKTQVFGFGYVFKKILGHSQNFTDTIWIVLALYFFSRILNMDAILGHRKMKKGQLDHMDKLYMYFRGICKKMTCQHFFPVFCKHTSDKRCKIDRGLTCHVVSYKRVLYIIVKASCFPIRISIAKKNSSEQLLKKSEAI